MQCQTEHDLTESLNIWNLEENKMNREHLDKTTVILRDSDHEHMDSETSLWNQGTMVTYVAVNDRFDDLKVK